MIARSPLVEVRNLRKEYPGVTALADAALAVRAGEIVGLVGKNGAGKSTLIKILAGIEHPDSGELEVEGEGVNLRSPTDAQKLGFAFVHQELTDIPVLSVAENLALMHRFPTSRLGLVRWHETRRRARSVLERLGIDIDVRRLTGDLSAVERRMVMIASALYTDARFVVLDEPTASLTPPEVEQLHRVMRGLQQHGVALLYVSHRLEEILETCDRVVVMRDGVTISATRAGETSREDLLAAITGDANAAKHEHLRRGPQPAEHRELLRVENLSRRGVVSNISFSLAAGEILGLAGLVGSGRTELARLLVGADRADSGQIFVRGVPTRIDSPATALAHGIVLLPEDRRHSGLVLSFGIRENMTLASLRRFRRHRVLPLPARRRERVQTRSLMDTLQIPGVDPEKRVALLSGGNQQKVVIGRWMLREPEILIFDEPTHGIDVGVKEAVFDLMIELAGNGKGIIFISSELREIERICSRALVLREGASAGFLERKELTEEEILKCCYGRE